MVHELCLHDRMRRKELQVHRTDGLHGANVILWLHEDIGTAGLKDGLEAMPCRPPDVERE